MIDEKRREEGRRLAEAVLESPKGTLEADPVRMLTHDPVTLNGVSGPCPARSK